MSSNLIIILSLLFICFDFENVNKYILFFHIPHSGHQNFKVLFRPNSNSTWLSYFPPLILFIISTQKLDCEQSLIFLLSHSGPIAQSTRVGRGAKTRGTRVIQLFSSPCVAVGKEGRPLAVYKKVRFSRLDQLNCFLPFVLI